MFGTRMFWKIFPHNTQIRCIAHLRLVIDYMLDSFFQSVIVGTNKFKK